MAEEYAELSKQEIMFIYKEKCNEMQIEPHPCFVTYLEETVEDNEALEIIIQGNDKLYFNNRVNDQTLIALCAALD